MPDVAGMLTEGLAVVTEHNVERVRAEPACLDACDQLSERAIGFVDRIQVTMLFVDGWVRPGRCRRVRVMAGVSGDGSTRTTATLSAAQVTMRP